MYRHTLAVIATALFTTMVGSSLPVASAAAPPPGDPAVQPLEQPPNQPPAALGPRRLAPSAAVTRDGFTSVQVNVDVSGANILGDAANEPSIAVDPTNPNRIVIGWRQFDSVESDFREAGYAYSRDAGRTWTFPGVLEEDVFRSDPVLDADSDGNIYFYSLTMPGFDCDLFKSTDGGATWEFHEFPFGGDKPWMTIDRTGGASDGNIYAMWRRRLVRSFDGGETLAPQYFAPEIQWGTMTVGPDGELYESANRVFIRSSNAQDPNAYPDFELETEYDFGGWANAAFDWPNPQGLLGQTWVACDHSSGPTRGNVYVLSSVVPNDEYDPSGDDPLDVHIVRSEDRGESWSPAVRVNDDPNGTNAYQWFGTMDVAPNGRIDAIWNDTRNDPNDPSQWPRWSELYYSFSEDAGETWSTNTPVSLPFNHTLGYPQQDKLGDYYHIRSDIVGVNVAYAATFNGEQDVWFLRIGDYDCNGNGVGDADDLIEGTSQDENANGVPDECDCLGDLDLDWDVDLADLGVLLAHYGETGNVAYQDGDVDEDGDIDSADLLMLLRRYGLGCP